MKPHHLLPLTLLTLLPACNPAHQVSTTQPGAADTGWTYFTPGAATPAARGTLALIHLQNPSGSFNGPAKTEHVGITALAALALLSASDVAPSTTAAPIEHAANFLLKSQREDGYIFHEGDGAGMYGHAFATLFLTQLYSTTTDANLKSKLELAIKKSIHLLEISQSPQGGWRYTPTPVDADVSVTAAEVKSLAAARDVGFTVAETTLPRAVSYLKSNQQPDGGFSYTLNGGTSGWARSAAATAAILYVSTSALDTAKSLAYLEQPNSTPNAQNNFYYGNYYFAQALNLDPAKTKSAASLRAAILARQSKITNLWSGEAGDPYATAMALIILYMPDSHLPAFKPPVTESAK